MSLSDYFKDKFEDLINAGRENGQLMAAGMSTAPLWVAGSAGTQWKLELRAGTRVLWAPLSASKTDEVEIWAVLGPEISREYHINLRSLLELWAKLTGATRQERDELLEEADPIIRRANLGANGHLFGVALPALRLRFRIRGFGLPELLEGNPSFVLGGGTTSSSGFVAVRLLDFADGGHFVSITGMQATGSLQPVLQPLLACAPRFAELLRRFNVELTGTIGAVYVRDVQL